VVAAAAAAVLPASGATHPGVCTAATLTGQTGPVEGYDARTYGEAYADVYDDWYADITDVDTCSAFVARLAEGRRALELGVGTGRLALPLAARGVEVVGVDVSAPMLERMVAKPGGRAVRAVLADMAALPLRGPFGVVLVSFSTLFNLVSAEAQAGCLRESARVLDPEGHLVIEAFVPRDDLAERANWVSVRTIARDRLVLQASLVDVDAQTVEAQHVEITESGIRLRPLAIRYLYPAQLDDLAARAGLVLEARHAGWSGEPFDDDSPVHVSVYRPRR
jgi:ubiquinone/menaquinone biosynthesis C-methylase UbiE